MRIIFLWFGLGLSLFASQMAYEKYTKQIIESLNYIYQEKVWTGGSTYASARKFTYKFRALSPYDIEITRNIDGVYLEQPFIIDLRQEYFVQLQPDDRCDPALIISNELDIIYLYVKDRCGNFGGFNLYKRAEKMNVLLKEHFYEAYRLGK